MDFHCAKCGEPWDTRGLHHSHFDMQAIDAHSLVNGVGCPCCKDNIEAGVEPYSDENLIQWARDLERVSEGSIWADPNDAAGLKIRAAGGVLKMSAKAYKAAHLVSMDEMGIE